MLGMNICSYSIQLPLCGKPLFCSFYSQGSGYLSTYCLDYITMNSYENLSATFDNCSKILNSVFTCQFRFLTDCPLINYVGLLEANQSLREIFQNYFLHWQGSLLANVFTFLAFSLKWFLRQQLNLCAQTMNSLFPTWGDLSQVKFP